MPAPVPNFDRLARPYRWLEYLTLGPFLQRTRTHYLAFLPATGRALVLGDGDGRFTAALLRAHPSLRVEAVDASRGMLAALSRRSSSVTITLADLRTYTPTGLTDLIATHFVLDCLTQPEVDASITRLAPHLAPQGHWLISDFRLPDGPMHWPARLYIRALYLAFRLLTGLRVTALPNHEPAMQRAGLELVAEHRTVFGLLTTQLWLKT